MSDDRLPLHGKTGQAPNINTNNPRKARIAPLVQKVAPITVIGRQPFPDQQTKNVKFIQPVTSRVVNMSAEVKVSDDKLIIDNFEAYYSLVNSNAELLQDPDIESFVKLIESIPKACGCVRGQLRESAASSYARMLPILQARGSSAFDIMKKAKNVKTLIFKEKDIVLFEV